MEALLNAFLLNGRAKRRGKGTVRTLRKGFSKRRIYAIRSELFLYLKAMYYRTPEAISKAVSTIREFYELSEYKAEALWMLIYLDREYVYNKVSNMIRSVSYLKRGITAVFYILKPVIF